MRIEEISINSKEYPKQLKEIYNPPKKLYIIGNKKLLQQKGIAIVGARESTQYGKKIAFNISKELSQKGINIISGLALGIDTYAHLGCLKSKSIGKTIAVLGSGINEIYPKENIELAKNIIKFGGCIVSEYQPEAKANKFNFPKRNRIISGLSEGVLIVEANEKSGALITAEFALEQGREIFAIPGNIDKLQSRGCNLLIRDGAKIVLSYEDILEEL